MGIVIFYTIFTFIMTETWELVIKSLSKGDRKAYESVFSEFYVPLVLYACKFVKDHDVAEDIVQDFFCKLWEGRRHLPDIRSFKTYLYTSVRNRSLNYLRDKHSVSIEEATLFSESDFLKEMMEEEIYRELYAAIRKLPDKCGRILLLKLDGKDNIEIGKILGVTEETVRSQLRRGRELLQKNMTGLYTWVLLSGLFT